MAGLYMCQRCVPGNEVKNNTALLMLLNKNALSRMIKVRTFDRNGVRGGPVCAADRLRDEIFYADDVRHEGFTFALRALV